MNNSAHTQGNREKVSETGDISTSVVAHSNQPASSFHFLQCSFKNENVKDDWLAMVEEKFVSDTS